MAALKGPESEGGRANHIEFFRRSPEAGVRGVEAVVAQCDILIHARDVGLFGLKYFTAREPVGGFVSLVSIFQTHHILEAWFLGLDSVDVEIKSLNLQLITGNAAETLNVVGTGSATASGSFAVDFLDASSVKNKDFSTTGTTEVVGHFVDQNQVTSVDITTRNHGAGGELGFGVGRATFLGPLKGHF